MGCVEMAVGKNASLLVRSTRMSSYSVIRHGITRWSAGLCTRIQKKDCFALLKTERRFDLDASQLHNTYKMLIAEHHPDRYSLQGDLAVQEASMVASQITDAYTVLRYPHRRAKHLLCLLGAPLNEEMSSDDVGTDFLMDIMQMREEIDEFSCDPIRLGELRQTNKKRLDGLIRVLSEAFTSSNLDEARMLTAQLQYLQRIEEEIHARTDPT